MTSAQWPRLASLALLAAAAAVGWTAIRSCCGSRKESSVQWWRNGVVYEVYLRSFQDSDGDGVGDLKGVEARLDHLVYLGVDVVWLTPMFKSPMVDLGYDISDYKDVDPVYGTIDDFKDLVSACHSRGLKLILDFVPNHTSDQHPWFEKSLRGEHPYADYYVWKDPSGHDNETGRPLPPNNWVSRFRNSAWTYREERGQFNMHLYLPQQIDLDYRCPAVGEEMAAVLRHWMDLGVDGFRVDAALGIFEDAAFGDEPKSGKSDNPDEYQYLEHVHTWNQPETREIALPLFHKTVKDYAVEANDGRDRLFMVQASTMPLSFLPEMYACCSDLPMTFEVCKMTSAPSAARLKEAVDEVLSSTPPGQESLWVLGSHDYWRLATRFGSDLVDAFHVVVFTLPGVVVTFQGEEIGMTNNMDIPFEQTLDPKGRNRGPEGFRDPLRGSRDFSRTPMQWSSKERHAGFTSEDSRPWRPVHPDYETVSVAAQKGVSGSHLEVYRRLLKLKKSEEALRYGSCRTAVLGDSVLAVVRESAGGGPALLGLVNLGESNFVVDVGELQLDTSGDITVELETAGGAGGAGGDRGVKDRTRVEVTARSGIVIKIPQ